MIALAFIAGFYFGLFVMACCASSHDPLDNETDTDSLGIGA